MLFLRTYYIDIIIDKIDLQLKSSGTQISVYLFQLHMDRLKQFFEKNGKRESIFGIIWMEIDGAVIQ